MELEVSSETKGRGESRRSFLVKLGLGITALAGISTGLVAFRAKRRSPETQEFPGPDSIFHPAKDPSQNPRRT